MERCAARASLVLSLLVAVPLAQGRRLNGPLANAVVGDVQLAVFSPDGSRVVFVAGVEVGRVDLFSAPAEGGEPVRLTPLSPAGGSVVTGPVVTPDSARVVYRADQDTDGVFELYSVPIDGGPSVKLNAPLAPGASVHATFLVSPTTGRVAYRHVGGGETDLWSARSDGALPPIRLNASTAFEQVEPGFAISNDGLGVAYRSDANVDERVELFVTRLDGTIAPQLRSAPGADESDVLEFAFAPLDTHLVYRANHAGPEELWSVPVVGGTPTKLNPTPPANGGVGSFAISGDGATVVYTAFGGGLGSALRAVPIGGGASTELEADGVLEFAIGGEGSERVVYLDDEDENGKDDLHTVSIEGGPSSQYGVPNTDVQPGFAISPDGSRVVYRAINTLFASQPRSLYSAPIEGGTPVRLNDVTLGDPTVAGFAISPDSASVVYIADESLPGVDEAWIVPIAGGDSTRLNATLDIQGEVLSAQLDPSGARAIYRADQLVDGVVELFAVPSSGGDATKLNPPLATTLGTNGDVWEFRLAPDGGQAVYRADQRLDEVFELYHVSSVTGVHARITPDLAPGEDVVDLEVSPDWSRVFYVAAVEQAVEGALFSVPSTGGPVVALDAGALDTRIVERLLRFSPDSTRVVYRADQGSNGSVDLVSVPLAGGAAVRLNQDLAAGGVAWSDFRVASDSSRVVYRAREVGSSAFELFSVPIAGGAVVQLNPALVPNGGVESFEIVPDATRVVYRADQDEDGVSELYCVPIAGGAAVRLNAALVSGGDVREYLVAPDSSRVVYRADQDQDEVLELFSVPLAGGAATQLNGALVLQGDVQGDFAIRPDSLGVLYRADQETDGESALYEAPLAGGAALRLDELPPAAGRDVASARYTPDSTRVVYRADQDTDDVLELYGVTLATGTATRLHAPRPDGVELPIAFRISPDSSHVLLDGEFHHAYRRELVALPLVGGAPRSLSGLLPAAGHVESYDVRAGRVLYVADPETAGTFELFVTHFTRGVRQGAVSGGG